MKSKNYRSPLFYMGDKFKLLDQLKNIFSNNINNFIEPFAGGGSVFLNIKANKVNLPLMSDSNSINITLNFILAAYLLIKTISYFFNYMFLI